MWIRSKSRLTVTPNTINRATRSKKVISNGHQSPNNRVTAHYLQPYSQTTIMLNLRKLQSVLINQLQHDKFTKLYKETSWLVSLIL